MALNRDKEIESLKRAFKKLTPKGAFSSAYMLPVKSIFGSSNCVLEIKIPRGYPDKDVEIKMVNPIPHVWANKHGVITCPEWLRKLPLVYLLEAVLTQFPDFNNNGGTSPTAPNQQQQNKEPGTLQREADVAATTYKPDMDVNREAAPTQLDSGNISKGDSPSLDVKTGASLTASNRATGVDERVLKACRNPPTGVFHTLASADREEVVNMLTNDDTRWKILYSCPQLEPLLSELQQLLDDNEAAALAVISTVNKKQEYLKSIEQKIRILETMDVKPSDAAKQKKKYHDAYHAYNKTMMKSLKQQIAEKMKNIEQGDVSFEECYEELNKLHRKCNELATLELATLG